MIKTQKEFPAPPQAHVDLQPEFEPKRLTPWQNIVLTAKVFGAIGLVVLVVWLIQQAKG